MSDIRHNFWLYLMSTKNHKNNCFETTLPRSDWWIHHDLFNFQDTLQIRWWSFLALIHFGRLFINLTWKIICFAYRWLLFDILHCIWCLSEAQLQNKFNNEKWKMKKKLWKIQLKRIFLILWNLYIFFYGWKILKNKNYVQTRMFKSKC